jgi:hypothetical protein
VFRWVEHAIARRADVVIANTDGAMVKWQEEFPSVNGKVHVIWNGFDPEERIEPLPVPVRNYKVLSHVGHLYHNRTASPILESIARLIAAGRLSPARIRVRLVGSTEPGVLPSQQFLDRARNAGWLDLVTERIPQRDALQIARSSDSLLLLQPQSTTQVPGKLFEYLQIGRPILAFVQPASPSERLLKRSGVPHRCAYPGSAPEAIDEVVACFLDLPSTPVAPGPEFEERFNVENQTRMLDAMIRSLHGGPLREIVPSSGRSAEAKRSTPNRRTEVHDEVGKAAVKLGNRA